MILDLTAIMTTLGLYAVAVASPGPNFALVSRLTLAGSRRPALGATLGLGFAATLYAVLTMAGLAVLLTRIGWLATAVQIGGGCYLIYLGVKTWLSSNDLAHQDLRTDAEREFLVIVVFDGIEEQIDLAIADNRVDAN